MTQSIHIRDREKDKFDADGNIKVSIEQNNATAEDQDVIVKNTTGEPVPVTIVNPDSNIDLEVQIQPNITIDDSTPIDVNVTNTVATNATIQGTPAVTVDGSVDIDDATAVRVDVTNANIATNATIQNASLNTNATIQNAELDVNVTNTHVNVYSKLYDGASWVNQASDSDGRAIVKNKKLYTAADITALGSSTSVNEWVNAYSDDILVYKYVGSYDDEFEAEVYYTHPDLGDGNKCLKLLYTYVTENSQTVVNSVVASVVDWTFDGAVQGTLVLTLGTITSPDPESSIAIGTDVCTISVACTTGGNVTIALSGANASLYTLRNVTDGTTGSSLAYDAAKSYVLETASDFSGSSYTHSLTITATEDAFSFSDAENLTTSGIYTTPSFVNDRFVTDLYRSSVSGSNNVGNYFRDCTSDGAGFFPDLDQASDFRTSPNVSYSFWLKRPFSGGTLSSYRAVFSERYSITDGSGRQSYYALYIYGAYLWSFTVVGLTYRNRRYDMPNDNDWHHFCLTTTTDDIVTGEALYIDGSAATAGYVNITNTVTRVGADVTNINFGGILLANGLSSGTLTGISGSGNITMDEFSSWKKTLSGGEVNEIYNNGTPNDLTNHSASTDLQRWFRFGDTTGDGTVIKDSQNTSYQIQTWDGTNTTTDY